MKLTSLKVYFLGTTLTKYSAHLPVLDFDLLVNV